MENDPNKKESKGKRILKKALRRNSKSSNGGQEQGSGVSRSKSFENNRTSSCDVEAGGLLPRPDATADATVSDRLALGSAALSESKKVEIHESHNERADIETAPDADDPFLGLAAPLSAVREPGKRNLKRKLEDESGAGTSGASAASESDADDKDPSKDKKKKNRCAVCRKKVGLTGFECRCGGLFCAVHRYTDKHECSFDYRELGAQEIRRNNPVVVSQKIHKI